MPLLSHLTSSIPTKSHFANSLDTVFNEPVPIKVHSIPAKTEGLLHPQLLHLVYT